MKFEHNDEPYNARCTGCSDRVQADTQADLVDACQEHADDEHDYTPTFTGARGFRVRPTGGS